MAKPKSLMTDALRKALLPLKWIADAYDDNALDSEARKRWGDHDQHHNKIPPADIILYSGRGGRTLLTLQHCFDAREALEEDAIRGEFGI